ncbi:MAG: diaminopimelate decarboxylase [Planctomycetia bacterium]|nr:diaminopimelate decarboxylase [Planctomycetia bacterium]MCC7315995.1 diaminopimelate decarboxylase [Planctomycetota bacterium]
MDHFHYTGGELHCEQVPIARIAKEVGTPAYVYSSATLLHHYDAVAKAFAALNPIICYSIKSCANQHICKLLKDRGAGFDVVSGGELYRALQAGGDPAKIVFAGVGKTDDEINQGIDAKIGWFNIESEAELENLIEIARKRRVTVNAALRVNPDVDPKTHRYTSTGKKETKFGVDLERARRVFNQYAKQDNVRLSGIHLHIGSPVNSVEPYVAAIKKTLALIDELRADGFTIDTLDIGGGFGAHYKASEAPPAVEYAEAIVPLLVGRDLKIIMEPGRSIAANAGILISRVVYLKKSGDRDFLIVDAGMNDLIRPALYEAYHFIWPVNPVDGFLPSSRGEDATMPGLLPMDVVGPVCESGDFLAKDRLLPPMKRGDLVAVFTAGAYGFVMASHYNTRPNPPEVLVEGDAYRIIRRRETYDDLLAAEQ